MLKARTTAHAGKGRHATREHHGSRLRRCPRGDRLPSALPGRSPVSQGKRLTLAAAKASARMEALEHHSAERSAVRLCRASADDLCQRGEAIAWAGLPRRTSGLVDIHVPLLWARGRDLANGGSAVWAPFSVVHTDWTHPVAIDASWFVVSSNGLASGNRLLEAVSVGICEVVEGDAKLSMALFSGASITTRTACV